MMKMNTKAFGTLVLLTVLVIGVVFISGCVEAPEEKAPTPIPQEEITPPEEVQPEPGTVPAEGDILYALIPEEVQPEPGTVPAEGDILYALIPEEVQPEPGTVPEKAQLKDGTILSVYFTRLIPFLPDPPSGWVGEEPDGMMMIFDGISWSIAERRYTKPDVLGANASVSIATSAYSIGEPWMMWEEFIEYETTDGYLKNTSFKGYPAWKEHIKPDHYALHVNMDGRFIVSISVNGVDRDALYAFADQINYSRIGRLSFIICC